MYIVSQITPLEWKKAAVCSHDDFAVNDNEFHLCKNSSNSFDGHEDFMSTREAGNTAAKGNGSENYSTLERYLKNASEFSEEDSIAWMNIEHRQNFLEKHHQHDQHQDNEFGSSRRFDEHLDIDDDGLIGFEETHLDTYSTYNNEELEANNIELISYENNFNLKNSFWWAMGTLIQSASDIYPKV